MVLKFSMQKEIQSFSSVMEKKEKLVMQYINNRNKRGQLINKNQAIWYFRLSDMNEVNHHAVQIVNDEWCYLWKWLHLFGKEEKEWGGEIIYYFNGNHLSNWL